MSELRAVLGHIRDFQMNDLRNALRLGRANFLTAQGGMNVLEFIGGLLNGELGDERKTRSRFTAGVDFIGGEYAALGKDDMYRLRNGLTHQYVVYLPSFKEIVIDNGESDGNALLRNADRLTFNVARFLVDLERAWDLLLAKIETEDAFARSVAATLGKLPELK